LRAYSRTVVAQARAEAKHTPSALSLPSTTSPRSHRLWRPCSRTRTDHRTPRGRTRIVNPGHCVSMTSNFLPSSCATSASRIVLALMVGTWVTRCRNYTGSLWVTFQSFAANECKVNNGGCALEAFLWVAQCQGKLSRQVVNKCLFLRLFWEGRNQAVLEHRLGFLGSSDRSTFPSSF
jgi:hypothetical protein